jgi:hypothetical protein
MELLDKIKAALDDMRPQLQADGGDLEFVSFEDNKEYTYAKVLQHSNDSHLYKEDIMTGYNNSLPI